MHKIRLLFPAGSSQGQGPQHPVGPPQGGFAGLVCDQAAISGLQTIWSGPQQHPPNTLGCRTHPVQKKPSRSPQAKKSAEDTTLPPALGQITSLPTSAGQLGAVGTILGNPAPGLPQLHLAEKRVCTPLRRSQFESELASHNDKAGVNWLLNSIMYGVSIGFSGPHTPYISSNLPSAAQHPHIITAELHVAREVEAGRVLGPFATIPTNTFRSSGRGVIPKKNGKWRMILHLSAPFGSSVNDGIDNDQFPVQYSTVDDAVEMISRYGTGAILAKIDLKAAFRMVPIDSKDWDLLGMQWQGGLYLDTCLPFGLQSAPYLFNPLHWILDNNYQVDVVAGAPGTDECSSAVQLTLSACESLGIPVAFDKLEGPSTHHARHRGPGDVPSAGEAGGHPVQGPLMVVAPQCHQT